MKNGFLKSFLATLLLTAFVYTILKNKSSLRSLSFLSFSEKTISQIRNQVCENTNDNFLDFYKNNGNNFTVNINDGNSLLPTMIEEFIKTNTLSQDTITDYIIENGKYIFYMVLLVLFILLWIPYFLIIFCRKCFCIPDCFSNCIKSFLLLALIFSGGVAICCIVGYTQNSGIFHGIFGTGCSVLKLEEHLINGDEYKVKPYWIGILPIIEKLNNTENFINNLPESSDNLKNKLNKIKTEKFPDFNTYLDNEYESKKYKEIANPDPNGYSDKITPGVINGYETMLEGVKTEFNTFGETSTTIIEEVLGVIDLGTQTEDIANQLGEIVSFMQDTVNSIDGKIVDLVGDYIDYLDMGDSYFRISMNYFYTINIILIICSILAFIGLLLCGKGKCFLCLAWFFLYILMLFALILGIVFGLFGTAFQDVAYGAKYLLNQSGNLSIIEDDQVRGLVDTCLNGNGSLAANGAMGMDISFNNSMIDSIYLLENELEKAKNNLSSYELFSLGYIQEQYNEFEQNPKPTSPELIESINTIRLYIDAGYENNFISETSSIKTYDTWEVNETNCEEGYTVLNSPNTNNNNRLRNLAEENKYCLIIQKWTKEQILSRYSSVKLNDEGITESEIVTKYYDSIIKFLNENKNLMSEMRLSSEDIKTNFKAILSQEVEVINGIGDTVKPIREIFEEIVGNDSIFSMLNCGFLKRDLNKILEQLYGAMGGEMKRTSSIFIAITIIEGILTVFTLIIMTRFKEPTEEPKPSEITEKPTEVEMKTFNSYNGECQQI